MNYTEMAAAAQAEANRLLELAERAHTAVHLFRELAEEHNEPGTIPGEENGVTPRGRRRQVQRHGK
jgi:hypothetical protein